MVRIRVFEDRVKQLFLARKLPGFVHVYVGQEAVAAGICAVLRPDDYITSTHRGHGHAIAKGVGLDRLMAELYGKETGVCRGRGGSMHVADFELGMLGANGIVAAGCGLATGAALSALYRSSGQVAVSFFGDGGINKGIFHEAANFAAVKRLPVIFACENNRFAQYTGFERTTSVGDLSRRAVGYGMPGVTVDGNDAVAVLQAAEAAVEAARSGEGPTLLNLETYRFGGHFVGDAEEYRTKDEVAAWREHDPIPRLEARLLADGVLDAQAREGVWSDAAAEVANAERFAEESAYPDPGGALEGLFTP
jgi:TPP-dependent pyruvate/acetoin dehydrogenase alpha subunit